jgi:hypothetical protein
MTKTENKHFKDKRSEMGGIIISKCGKNYTYFRQVIKPYIVA